MVSTHPPFGISEAPGSRTPPSGKVRPGMQGPGYARLRPGNHQGLGKWQFFHVFFHGKWRFFHGNMGFFHGKWRKMEVFPWEYGFFKENGG